MNNQQINESIRREREAERYQAVLDQKRTADMADAYKTRSDIPEPTQPRANSGRNSRTGY